MVAISGVKIADFFAAMLSLKNNGSLDFFDVDNIGFSAVFIDFKIYVNQAGESCGFQAWLFVFLGCFFGLGFESCFGLRLFLWALAVAPLKRGVGPERFGAFSPVSAEGFCVRARCNRTPH